MCNDSTKSNEVRERGSERMRDGERGERGEGEREKERGWKEGREGVLRQHVEQPSRRGERESEGAQGGGGRAEELNVMAKISEHAAKNMSAH